MNAFKAHYFDGQTSRAHEVEVRRDDATNVHVCGSGMERSAPLASLRISPRLARTARTIEFADGARLLVDDHALLDQWFPNEDRLQRWVDRMERHAYAIASSVLICAAMGVVTFVWGVPWLSDRIAGQVPAGVEATLGDEVLGQLDRYLGFAASTVESSRQGGLSARFATLTSDLPGSERYRLVFRDAPGVGANALAVPGGTIVVTDQLVALLEDDREFDAVVAHELGHQQHRHALRQTLRSSFVLVIAALFTGDVSSASTVVVAVPAFLLQSHYSRGFEEEADGFAFTTLAAHGISPAWFASAMRKLDADHDMGDDKGGGIAYLSSHPSSSARIAAAEISGEEFVAAHPELARENPGYDACLEEGICPDVEETDDDGECVDPADFEAIGEPDMLSEIDWCDGPETEDGPDS